MSQFWSGTVQEAIAVCKQNDKILVVFLRGENADGSAAEDHLLEFLSEISTEARSRLVVLRLLDDLEDRSPDNFKDAKNFRMLYRVERLPSLVCLAANGTRLAQAIGTASNRWTLRDTLVDAQAAHLRQSQPGGTQPAPGGAAPGPQGGPATAPQAPAEAVTQQALSLIIAAMQQELANQAATGQGSSSTQAPASQQAGVQSAGPAAPPPAVFSHPAGQQHASDDADAGTSSGATQIGALGKDGSEGAVPGASTASQLASSLDASEDNASPAVVSIPGQAAVSKGSSSGEMSSEAAGPRSTLGVVPAVSAEQEGHAAMGTAAVQEGPGAASVPAEQEGPAAASVPAVQEGPAAASVPAVQEGPAATSVPDGQEVPTATGTPAVQQGQASQGSVPVLPHEQEVKAGDAGNAVAKPPVTSPSVITKASSAEGAGGAASSVPHTQVGASTSGSSVAKSGAQAEAAGAAPRSLAKGAAQPLGQGGTVPQAPAVSTREPPPARAGQAQEESARAAAEGKGGEKSGRGADAVAGQHGGDGGDAGAGGAKRGVGGKSEGAGEKEGPEDEEAKALGIPFEVDGEGASLVAKPALPRTAHLQFRLTDGTMLREQFPADTPLQEVRAWLDLHRTDGGGPYSLCIPFPYRQLGPEDGPRSLQQLDLAPRASLHLRPDLASAQSHRGGASLLDCLRSLLDKFWGAAPAAAPPPPGPPVPGNQGPSSRSKPGPLSNVHSLHEPRGDDSPPNDYWNGNSTQFRGDDL